MIRICYCAASIISCQSACISIPADSAYTAIAAASVGVPIVIRVPGHELGMIGRYADLVPAGLMAPMVNSAAEADAVVRAVRYAKETGAKTISLVGFDGGMLHQESDCSILVPADSTPQTEAIHLVIEHLLMDELKRELARRTDISVCPTGSGATK